MKKILLILLILLSGCSSGRHYVIGIGTTEFDNDKISTRIIGMDFLRYGGKNSFGFGYHNNVIIVHKIEGETKWKNKNIFQ